MHNHFFESGMSCVIMLNTGLSLSFLAGGLVRQLLIPIGIWQNHEIEYMHHASTSFSVEVFRS